MDPNQGGNDLQRKLQERFKELPKVVQDAITSADVEKHLRALSDTHKLHLDQWEKLENEVTLTLLGFEPIDNLEQNIQKEVGLPAETARTLAEAINQGVFEPIRKELERELAHPEAQTEQKTGVEQVKEQILGTSSPAAPAAVVPGTPPPPPVAQTVARAPASGAYKSGQPSAARKEVNDDPYRESVV